MVEAARLEGRRAVARWVIADEQQDEFRVKMLVDG